MNCIFSTREVATAIWLVILILYCVITPSTRKAIVGVVTSACTPKLSISFICIFLYTATFVALLTFIPLWKWIYIKDIFLWFLFAGAPTCYKAIGTTPDEHYFRNIFYDNIKFIVLVEFFISTFTFNFIIEILIIPAIVFLAMLDAIAATKPEFSSAKKFTGFLLSLSGLCIIFFALKEALNIYKTLGAIDLLVSFFIPIIFSLLYIPVAYLFAVYAEYEMLFIRMSFKSSSDRKVKRRRKLAVIGACGLSYKRITHFEKKYSKNMYVSMEQEKFDTLLKIFKAEIKLL